MSVITTPTTINPTTANQISIWDGSEIVQKELKGFTIDGTTIQRPVFTKTNHTAATYTNTTTLVTLVGADVPVGNNEVVEFTHYIVYTTNLTSTGLSVSLGSSTPANGVYVYDVYSLAANITTNGGPRYNSSAAIVIPSSTTGTNCAIVRGLTFSSGGSFTLSLKLATDSTSNTTINIQSTGFTTYKVISN